MDRTARPTASSLGLAVVVVIAPVLIAVVAAPMTVSVAVIVIMALAMVMVMVMVPFAAVVTPVFLAAPLPAVTFTLVARNVFALVPVATDEVDAPTTGAVLRAVPFPVALVARRND